MANKFLTWLENVPSELKKLFTNKTIDSAISGGLGLASLIDPALAPLLNGIAAAVAKAEALAAAAGVQSGSGAQKLSIAVADAQAVLQAYEQATGKKIENDKQVTIINAIVAILNSITSDQSSPASVIETANVTVSMPTPIAPSVQQQEKTGTLL